MFVVCLFYNDIYWTLQWQLITRVIMKEEMKSRSLMKSEAGYWEVDFLLRRFRSLGLRKMHAQVDT